MSSQKLLYENGRTLPDEGRSSRPKLEHFRTGFHPGLNRIDAPAECVGDFAPVEIRTDEKRVYESF
jgi:hypothetical protein